MNNEALAAQSYCDLIQANFSPGGALAIANLFFSAAQCKPAVLPLDQARREIDWLMEVLSDTAETEAPAGTTQRLETLTGEIAAERRNRKDLAGHLLTAIEALERGETWKLGDAKKQIALYTETF